MLPNHTPTTRIRQTMSYLSIRVLVQSLREYYRKRPIQPTGQGVRVPSLCLESGRD